jgi:putative ABC transport system substrate-binding protein
MSASSGRRNRRQFLLRGARLALAAGASTLLVGCRPSQPVTGRGQDPRVALIWPGSSDESLPMLEALRQGLGDHGYREGQSIAFEQRWADGSPDLLRSRMDELVSLRPDVIVPSGFSSLDLARLATRGIPIVVAGGLGDPVKDGLVDVYQRPRGNITGVLGGTAEHDGKRLDLLLKTAPRISRIAVLQPVSRAGSAQDVNVEPFSDRRLQDAARSLAVQVQVLRVQGPEDLEDAFFTMREDRARAVMVDPSPMLWVHRRSIAVLAVQGGLISMYSSGEYVQAGGLMSYGPTIADTYRRVAMYIDRILKGAAPSSLPFSQPSELEVVINLGTAQALGLAVPPSVRARATTVIHPPA